MQEKIYRPAAELAVEIVDLRLALLPPGSDRGDCAAAIGTLGPLGEDGAESYGSILRPEDEDRRYRGTRRQG